MDHTCQYSAEQACIPILHIRESAALHNSGFVPFLGIGFLSFVIPLFPELSYSWGPRNPRYGVVAQIQYGRRVASEVTFRGTVYVRCGKVNLAENLSDDGIGVTCVLRRGDIAPKSPKKEGVGYL